MSHRGVVLVDSDKVRLLTKEEVSDGYGQEVGSLLVGPAFLASGSPRHFITKFGDQILPSAPAVDRNERGDRLAPDEDADGTWT